MTDRPETHTKLIAWTRALSLLTLVAPTGLVAAAWGFARAGFKPDGMWLYNAVVLAPPVGLLVGGLALIAALAFWLSRAATFRQVRAAVIVSVLGLVVNFLVMLFIISRVRY